MGVAPNILYAGSSGNQLTFTYTADSSSLRGQTLVEFPRGWTPPQRRNASGPGYVELRAGQCAASTKILSVGVRKVTIATTCKRHQSYQLVYSNVTAPQLTADGYVFLALTRLGRRGPQGEVPGAAPGQAARRQGEGRAAGPSLRADDQRRDDRDAVQHHRPRGRRLREQRLSLPRDRAADEQRPGRDDAGRVQLRAQQTSRSTPSRERSCARSGCRRSRRPTPRPA